MGLQASQKSESLSGYEYRIVYTYARILGGYLEELRDIIKSRLATSCGHSKSLARYYTSIVPKTTPTGKQLPLGNALKITKIELTDGHNTRNHLRNPSATRMAHRPIAPLQKLSPHHQFTLPNLRCPLMGNQSVHQRV